MNCSPYNITSFLNTVSLDTLLRHVMPIVPDLPHAMALDRVRQAYIEFARRSGLIVGQLKQKYQAGVHDYPLIPPDGYEVYQVLGFGSPGYSFVDYWGGNNYGLWNTRLDVIDNTTVYLHRAPSVDNEDGLCVYVALLPTSCVADIPVSIATPYGKGIASGALADILLIPNKPWTNPAIAGVHKLEFNRTVLAGKNLAQTNRKAGPLRAKSIRVV